MPQFATAEYHFREAIKYASEHINAHYNLGQLYRWVMVVATVGGRDDDAATKITGACSGDR